MVGYGSEHAHIDVETEVDLSYTTRLDETVIGLHVEPR